MIFVTMSSWEFERLAKEMDRIAGRTKEKVVMQTGLTKYKPKHAEYFRYTTGERIQELNKNARVVVTHAGAGCIITALKYGRPLVVVPRLKKFKEHIDDHQMIIAEFLERKGIVQAVYDIKDLEKKIGMARKCRYRSGRGRMVAFLKDYLKNLEAETGG